MNSLLNFENNLYQVKDKVRSIKESSKIKKEIEKANKEKMKLIQELGIIAYKKISSEVINDYDMISKCSDIANIDYLIYKNRKMIENINNKDSVNNCSCGYSISKQDRFCQSCGSEVNLEQDFNEYILCIRCNCKIDEKVKFCPCCGNKNV